jgi:hypothetical protein
MKMKPTTLFLVLILLLMVLTSGMALSFGHLEATLAPLLISGCIFVLALAELIRETTSKKQEPPPPDRGEAVSLTVVETAKGRGEGRRFAKALGWIGGYALGIAVFGFFPAALLFGLSYLKTQGHSWASAALFALCFTAGIYLIFAVAFQANLYSGLIFSLRR